MAKNFSANYDYPRYEPVIPEEVRTGKPDETSVAIVGAGPVGLAAALDLARHDISVVVLDDDDTVSTGSRAICWAKRTLEIFDRLDCAEPMMEKGVTWQKGRVFARDKEIYAFDLLPEPDHCFPAFINLQQYYVEQVLVDAAIAHDKIDLRWRNTVTDVSVEEDGVTLQVETPDGNYAIDARYGIAADGARSPVRHMLGLDFVGRVFEDRFLIADVKMSADFPTERWFWFLPPFHAGPSALLHKQADDIWRIDFQLGPDVDPDEEIKEANVRRRLEAMLGEDKDFELDWVSVYRFQARRLESFVHGRTFFAGDAAHQVSPFGARGGNSGIQDIDNLVWKLKLVLDGKADDRLLATYDAERVYAASENLRITSRTTDFMSAKGPVQTAFRDASLSLAEDWPFARRFVNAGRLSTPTRLRESPLNTPDVDEFDGQMAPGAACIDAPIHCEGTDDWLLRVLTGRFWLLYRPKGGTLVNGEERMIDELAACNVPVTTRVIGRDFEDVNGRIEERYDMKPGTGYLIRPDQHVAARWRSLDESNVRAALDRATGQA